MTLTVDYKVPDKRVPLAVVRTEKFFVEPGEEDIPHHVHITAPITNHVIVHLHVVKENGKFFFLRELLNNGWKDDSVIGELLVACRRCVEKLADIYLPKTPHPPLFIPHRCLIENNGRVCVSFFITKLYGFEYSNQN